MVKNVGTIDQIVRIALGVALVSLAIFGNMAWGWIGLILIATGFMNFCPVYRMLGMSSRKSEQQASKS